MREGMGRLGQRLLTATEKVWKVRKGRKSMESWVGSKKYLNLKNVYCCCYSCYNLTVVSIIK
jgi:hypothetical protein